MGEPEIFLPNLVLGVSDIDFSINTIGTSQTQHIQIVNSGEGELIGSLTLDQSDVVFSLQPSGAFVLDADDTLDVAVTFSPEAQTTYSASILLSSDDPSQPEIMIILSGEGTPVPVPVLSLSTSQLDFGTIVSDESSQLELMLSSTGTDTLLIESISIDLAVYQIDLSLPLSLIPGEFELLTLTFTPGSGGVFGAEMTIHSNSSGSPHQVSLSGAAENRISYSTSVQPVWDANCTSCHGGSGGLFLSSYTQLMAGNSNNPPVVIPFDGANSRIIKKLRGTAGERMPFGGSPIEPSIIAVIETWIDQGALNN